MAKFDFNIPTDFLKQLGKLEDVDRVAPQMIDEAVPILLENVKQEVAKHKLTGDMHKSIKKSKAGKTKKGGYFASVHPSGVDSKGVRNMEKLVYAEYGTSKQSPTPMLTKAIKDSESAVLKKMQEVFEREVKA